MKKKNDSGNLLDMIPETQCKWMHDKNKGIVSLVVPRFKNRFMMLFSTA